MDNKIYSNIRVLMKHALTVDWEKALNFTPKSGEIIVYDDRFVGDNNERIPGIKIGDDARNINALPFIDQPMIDHMADASVHYTITVDEANHKLIFA